jgi:hypothetical protein
MFVCVGGDWRGFEYAWQEPAAEPDEGPGLTWRQLTPRHWSGWPDPLRLVHLICPPEVGLGL